MKINFTSDNELSIHKAIEIPKMTLVVWATFYKNKK